MTDDRPDEGGDSAGPPPEAPLLVVQRLDTETQQLRHRRATLPQLETRVSEQAAADEVGERLATVAAQRVEVTTRQKRLEDEAQGFADRADADDARLYGGEVGLREMEALQDEIKGLRARQSDLEDRAIEAMEEVEQLSDEMAGLEAERDRRAEVIAALDAEIVELEAEIDGSLDAVAAERASSAAEVDPDHLASYERLRPGLGAATVVRFEGGNCVGCPSAMPAVEADRMKHSAPGSVLECSECGRIVLR